VGNGGSAIAPKAGVKREVAGDLSGEILDCHCFCASTQGRKTAFMR